MLLVYPLPALLLDAQVGELFCSSHDGQAGPRGNHWIHYDLLFAPLPGAVVLLPVLFLPGLWLSELLKAAVRPADSSYNAALVVLPIAKPHKNALHADYRWQGCDRTLYPRYPDKHNTQPWLFPDLS